MTCSRSREVDLAAFLVEPRAERWSAFRSHYPSCPDCSAEVTSLSEFERALEQAAAAPHPSDETLLAYGDQPASLQPDERLAIQSHLETCAACRGTLRDLQDFDLEAVLAGEAATGPSIASASTTTGGGLRRLLQAAREMLLPPTWSPALVAAALLAILAIPVSFEIASRFDGDAEPSVVAKTPSRPPARVDTQPVAEPAEEMQAQKTPAPEPQTPAPELVEKRSAEPTLLADRDSPVRSDPKPAPMEKTIPDPEVLPLTEEAVVAMLDEAGPLVYAAPAGVPADPTGARFGMLMRSAAPSLPELNALAPAHVGRTRRAAPALYWYLSTPTERDLVVNLLDGDSDAVLLEARLEGPHPAGIHGIHLKDHSARLEPGRVYLWYVSLLAETEPGPNDVVAGSSILRSGEGVGDADEALDRELQEAGPLREAHVYAAHGYWYDALTSISGLLESNPQLAGPLHQQRSALLKGAGLEAAAAFDYAIATSPER